MAKCPLPSDETGKTRNGVDAGSPTMKERVSPQAIVLCRYALSRLDEPALMILAVKTVRLLKLSVCALRAATLDRRGKPGWLYCLRTKLDKLMRLPKRRGEGPDGGDKTRYALSAALLRGRVRRVPHSIFVGNLAGTHGWQIQHIRQDPTRSCELDTFGG